MSADWIRDLDKYRKQVYSQCWEDGIINRIFECIGTLGGENGRFFVDFGAGDGTYNSNTANLRLNHGWKGILLDSNPKDSIIHKEFITVENINDILKKYSVPEEFDLLSIDVDGNDYWIWKAINYKPRVVIIEFNPNFPYTIGKTIRYDPDFKWDHKTNYYGASLLALRRLGLEKDYSLVYQADFLNAFFIQKKIVDRDIPIQDIFPKTFPAWEPDHLNRPWMIVESE